MQSDEIIFGIRAVTEAIEAGKDIDRILIKKDLQNMMRCDIIVEQVIGVLAQLVA